MENNSMAPVKKVYQSPSIWVYGDIGTITQVAMGTKGNDGGMAPNNRTG